MAIEATELLKLFTKVNKLGLALEVKEDKDGDYVIRIFEMFSSEYFDINVVISQAGVSTYSKGEYLFDSAMRIMDEKLEEQEQERIKAERREELIARLTPEERELLGVQ